MSAAIYTDARLTVAQQIQMPAKDTLQSRLNAVVYVAACNVPDTHTL